MDVEVDGAEDPLEDAEPVPSSIAAAEPALQVTNIRSSSTSSEKIDRRSSRVASEKTTLLIANVVIPIVRAIALLP